MVIYVSGKSGAGVRATRNATTAPSNRASKKGLIPEGFSPLSGDSGREIWHFLDRRWLNRAHRLIAKGLNLHNNDLLRAADSGIIGPFFTIAIRPCTRYFCTRIIRLSSE
jgi:hypothetical protein